MGLFGNPALFTTDENGFVTPASGGTLAAIGMKVEYTDTTEKEGPEIPDNAVPVALIVSVTEDFNDSTGDTLDIGITGTSDYFADDLDVSTAANFLPNDTGMQVGVYGVTLGSGLKLVATYTEATGDADQGIANIILVYYLAGEVVTLD